jgi:hypothetical protein
MRCSISWKNSINDCVSTGTTKAVGLAAGQNGEG